MLATGVTSSVREFAASAALAAGIEVEFSGKDQSEVGRNTSSGEIIFKVNPDFYRPSEVDLLVGDCAKANQTLGWKASMPVRDLCKMMVEADINRNQITG